LTARGAETWTAIERYKLWIETRLSNNACTLACRTDSGFAPRLSNLQPQQDSGMRLGGVLVAENESRRSDPSLCHFRRVNFIRICACRLLLMTARYRALSGLSQARANDLHQSSLQRCQHEDENAMNVICCEEVPGHASENRRL
jgi:hypothetical protein